MVTKKASIKRNASNTYLILNVSGKKLEIDLTDDNPGNVMSVFNDLLKELKKGVVQFELEDKAQDLYYHISKEYIRQLNAEIREVYNELDGYGLLEQK